MGAYFALAGLQLAGGFAQADITRQNGQLQDNIANMNAQFAELDAFNARAAGAGNAARYGAVVDQTEAADKSAEAGAGVDVNYGTAQDLNASNKIAGMSNVLQIQRQAQNQAAGLETQAINISLGGQMTQLQSNLNASSEQTAGIMSAVATGVAGYAYGQGTGKGLASKTGEDSTPGASRNSPVNVKVSSTGDGVAASPTTYGNGYGWYPDQGSSGPGFFGRASRDSYAGDSFTSEAS